MAKKNAQLTKVEVDSREPKNFEDLILKHKLNTARLAVIAQIVPERQKDVDDLLDKEQRLLNTQDELIHAATSIPINDYDDFKAVLALCHMEEMSLATDNGDWTPTQFLIDKLYKFVVQENLAK